MTIKLFDEFLSKHEDSIKDTQHLLNIVRLGKACALDPDDKELEELLKARIEQEQSDIKAEIEKRLFGKAKTLFEKAFTALGITLF